MNLSDPSLFHLIDLTYEAVEKPETWKTLYAEICTATGAQSVHMLGIDNRNGTLSYSDGANLPVQGELAYMQRYRRIDPRMPKLMERPLYEWLHCHELFDDSYVARDPFYQEFLGPAHETEKIVR